MLHPPLQLEGPRRSWLHLRPPDGAAGPPSPIVDDRGFPRSCGRPKNAGSQACRRRGHRWLAHQIFCAEFQATAGVRRLAPRSRIHARAVEHAQRRSLIGVGSAFGMGAER